MVGSVEGNPNSLVRGICLGIIRYVSYVAAWTRTVQFSSRGSCDSMMSAFLDGNPKPGKSMELLF